MSHLLHNPYNKPSPFDLPRAVQPLTPPDTDSEFVGQPFRSAPVNGTDPLDSDPIGPQVSAAETSTPFFRRQPSVSYIHSGPRDFRERGPQRSLIKWLVVVIPPTSFSREHGHLGHTLSSGAPNRLSQGILMPLFPTMGNQLGAIAREFSFPSTAGLCLYLHTNHNGISLYPRITDESWQLLWAHLFDVRGHATQQPQLPISGQIEFDIDFNKARWFDSWVASPRKDLADVPQSVAGHSRRPSLIHFRGDSRTTFLDEQADEPIPIDEISIVQQPKAPKMAPKKLSLLDRFDALSAVSTPKPLRRDSPQSPLSEAQYRVLSPIAQEEEPKTARKNVTNYVAAWRESAKISASPLAATGQTSLDAANMPNTLVDIPIAETEDDTSELNLDDYAWSVSSFGPADYDVDDGYDSESWRLPSPDLARRQLSDAPPSPTTATSWGAPLSYPPSPVYGHSDYSPSLDLAGRAGFSRPVTPATATSWGAPSYLASPVSARSGYAASVDLGVRAMSSRPATPSTATSWGPASWPASPAQYEAPPRVASPGLADRGMLSTPMTPATATSWGAPSYPVSPASSEFRVSSPDLGARMLSAPASPLPFKQRESAVEVSAQSNMLFPYYRLCDQKWELVWPFAGGEYVSERSRPQTMKAHPSSLLVFPYYSVRERSPSPAQAKPSPLAPARMVFPYYRSTQMTWKQVWPYQRQDERQGAIGAKYPFFNLYPAVYPAFDLYPSVVSVALTKADREKSVVLSGSYAAFNLYPAVYPHFEIYPAKGRREPTSQAPATEIVAIAAKPIVQVELARQYPFFDLYPAVYPWSMERIYPDMKTDSVIKAIVTTLPAAYPAFNIYPAVYPHNMGAIYPGTTDLAMQSECLVAGYPHFEIYPSIRTSKVETAVFVGHVSQENKSEVSVKLASQYPTFDLYPAVYPQNLRNVYPMHKAALPNSAIGLSSVYPSLVIYPAMYPWNLVSIYPPSGRITSKPTIAQDVKGRGTESIPITFDVCYPRFNLYPAVYPHNLERVYPSACPAVTKSRAIDASLSAAYPAFDLYPAVYPYNMERVYPVVRLPVSKKCTAQSKARSNSNGLEFVLCIYTCPYANVDPFLMIHPELADGYSSGSEVKHIKAGRYPALNIYPAVYPFFDIYAKVAGENSNCQRELKVTLCETRYPALEIYPAVYPSFRIYPEVVHETTLNTKGGVRVSLGEMRYPMLDIYPAVYPHFKLYPAVLGTVLALASLGVTIRYPVLDIYPAVYPNFAIYPPVWTVAEAPAATSERRAPAAVKFPHYTPRHMPRFTHAELHGQVYDHASASEQPSPAIVIAALPSYAPRRKPRFTHAQLHEQVFEKMDASEEHTCEEEDLWEMVTASVKTIAPPLPVPVVPLPPASATIQAESQHMPRRQPRYTHAQLRDQVLAQLSNAEAADTIAPLPQHSDRPSVGRSRPRSGSTTNRPIPPPKPADASMLKPPPPPPPRSSGLRVAPAIPRLSVAGAVPSSRPASSVGLPSHPAAMRRSSSTLIPGPRPPTLRVIPEPGQERSVTPTRRIAPKDSLETMRESNKPLSRINVDVRKSAYAPRSSVESLSPSPPDFQPSPELSRSNTMPPSKTGHSRSIERQTSIVMEKARAFDQSNTGKMTSEEGPAGIIMPVLSKFPTPPRPPLPNTVSPTIAGRPVSKLDRSKFPFH
ncbi:hypothetical protein DAEQUDRAFT_720557 [Daedalea quercina L-15889]|uniref:Uncharacterized protein n=1 Tax=Daedalea quercina L-15889 TaxID=1314783 RepID=A0A165U4N5_9APHY|nr:hypothetical protein DAEQUDRAFT_720557 [Daedalea quercina L-15889]